jgi:hypothetical protein
VVDWLLNTDEPGIRLQTRRDLLGEKVAGNPAEILAGPIVARLLTGQQADGGFGVHPYQKWSGAHWRLVSLVELGVPANAPQVKTALEHILAWLSSSGDPDDALVIRGLPRVHGSIYANALAVAVRLGRSTDRRVRNLAEWLVGWQWPDGGWNCDRHTHVTHSSFYESITPMYALAEFGRATGDQAAAESARRAAEFFLSHRVYKSHTTDKAGDPKWLRLRYPEYWHYDYLHGLVLLARAGALPDARANEALKLLREQHQTNGRWVADGPQYWKAATGPYSDPARWNATSASQMLTLNALRVLRAAGA